MPSVTWEYVPIESPYRFEVWRGETQLVRSCEIYRVDNLPEKPHRHRAVLTLPTGILGSDMLRYVLYLGDTVIEDYMGTMGGTSDQRYYNMMISFDIEPT